MKRGKAKAVGLLSGGLDSTLAAKILLEQGIQVYAINFTSPFCTCTPKSAGCAAAITAVRQLGGIPLRRVALNDEYLEIIRKPRFGHGSGINPCIDCRIEKIKKAGRYMKEIGASFVFTGEVLGQRPMSQHSRALKIIDEASGLKGYILRPLSARFLEPTVPERKGLVNREQLLALKGRSRKDQIKLARMKGIRDYPCPAGGCLLTDKNFAERMRDYFKHTEKPSMRDIPLLKVGRHFRLESGDKVIVARNEDECRALRSLYREEDHMLVPGNFPGPVVILQGADLEAAKRKLFRYTKRQTEEDLWIAHFHAGRKKLIRVKTKKYDDNFAAPEDGLSHLASEV